MREPKRPVQLRGKVFKGSDVVKEGLLTRNDLRSSAWRSLFRDVYADQAVQVTHKLRCIAACAYLLPKGAVIAGRSAAHVLGAPFLRAEAQVEVITPKRFGPVKGLQIREANLEDDEIVQVGFIRATSVIRTCWDLARWHSAVEAVTHMDALVAKRLVEAKQIVDYAQERAGVRGWSSLLRAAMLVDAGAESPQESRLRVETVIAGLPRMVTQFVVTDERGFVARVDLALPELKIAVEYDGEWHANREQLELDRKRINRLVAAGWIVVFVTSRRMRTDFPAVVAEIKAAIKSRTAKIAQHAGM